MNQEQAIEDAKNYRAGNAPERPGDGRAANPSGLYRDPESGAEIIALATPKFGSPQADAFVRMGFKFIRPAEKGEIVYKRVVPNVEPTDSVEELEAKLKAAKAEKKKLATVKEDQ